MNWLRGSGYGPVRRLFNIAREDSLASWFAVTQTVFVALAAWTVFMITKARDPHRRSRWGWFLVALVFSYFAVDDGAAIHEQIGRAHV